MTKQENIETDRKKLMDELDRLMGESGVIAAKIREAHIKLRALEWKERQLRLNIIHK